MQLRAVSDGAEPTTSDNAREATRMMLMAIRAEDIFSKERGLLEIIVRCLITALQIRSTNPIPPCLIDSAMVACHSLLFVWHDPRHNRQISAESRWCPDHSP